MKTDKENEYALRDSVQKLLSDTELATVSNAEGAMRVADDEEYLDLDHLEEGVLRGRGAATVPMGRVLPKKAVHAATWAKIVAMLPTSDRS